MREPYERDGRIIIEDPYVSEFGTEEPPCEIRDDGLLHWHWIEDNAEVCELEHGRSTEIG